jgi:hypothetical protein
MNAYVKPGRRLPSAFDEKILEQPRQPSLSTQHTTYRLAAVHGMNIDSPSRP